MRSFTRYISGLEDNRVIFLPCEQIDWPTERLERKSGGPIGLNELARVSLLVSAAIVFNVEKLFKLLLLCIFCRVM